MSTRKSTNLPTNYCYLRFMRTVLRPLLLLPLGLLSLMLGCAIPLDQKSSLHTAAERGDVKTVRDLVGSGSDVNAKYGDYTVVFGYTESSGSRVRNKTALMFAAENGHLEVVKLLVDAHADIYVVQENARGDQRGNAFDLSVEKGHTAIAQFLWERSDKVRFARHLDRQLAYTCARFCSPRHGTTPDKNLALFIASINPTQQILGVGIGLIPCHSSEALQNLKFLLAAGIKFPKNTLGCVATSELGKKQSLEIASLLIEQGADPNFAGPAPFTASPLMLAASKHNSDMVGLLLKHGANPNYRSPLGATPLTFAGGTCYYGAMNAEARKRQRIVVEQLIAAGAHITAQDESGRTYQGIAGACCEKQAMDREQAQICRLLTGKGLPNSH